MNDHSWLVLLILMSGSLTRFMKAWQQWTGSIVPPDKLCQFCISQKSDFKSMNSQRLVWQNTFTFLLELGFVFSFFFFFFFSKVLDVSLCHFVRPLLITIPLFFWISGRQGFLGTGIEVFPWETSATTWQATPCTDLPQHSPAEVDA